MHRITLTFLAALLLLAAPALAQDKVVGKDGKEKTVKIASEDYDGLKVSVEGGSNTIQWKDVDQIKYANAGKYPDAVDTLISGSASDALAKLQAIGADEKLRPVLRHNVLYYTGLAQQKLGQTADAIATFEKLLKDFPKSRYIVSVGTNLLALYVEKGDVAGAGKTLDGALQAAGGAGEIKISFDFLRGRLLEEQKKYSDAERLFQGVSTASGADPEVVLQSKLAIARCAQADGKRKDDADKRYHELTVATNASNEVLAGAWNGLADMALADATQKRDAEGLRTALFDYLRGCVLYTPAGGGSTTEYERALAGASLAFKALGEVESDPAKKKQFQQRAAQKKDQLNTEFPRSRYRIK